jgi:hypothetical protein
MERHWLPSFADLIDRLSIHQLKEVFIPEYKEKYRKEMNDIVHDIDLLCSQKDIKLTGQLVRAIVVLSQINEHIWYNESNVRSGTDQDLNLLKLTHGLNGVRNQTMNFILNLIGETDRRDYKTDCLAAEFSNWEIDLDWEYSEKFD